MIQTIIDGHFTKNQAEKIKAKLQGKTYFNFDIEIGNQAGNCTLVVKSNNTEYTPDELKAMFYFCCLGELAAA